MNQVVLNENTVTLSGSITRREVGRLREELLAALTAVSRPRVIRLTNVDTIDSAGVQLLSALLKGFPNVRVSEVPDAVRRVLERLGVAGMFGGA